MKDAQLTKDFGLKSLEKPQKLDDFQEFTCVLKDFFIHSYYQHYRVVFTAQIFVHGLLAW